MDNKNTAPLSKSVTPSPSAAVLEQQKAELQTQSTENLRTIFKDAYGTEADDLLTDDQLIEAIMQKVPPSVQNTPPVKSNPKDKERSAGISKPAVTADKVYGNRDTAKKYPIPANLLRDPNLLTNFYITVENRIGTVQETGGSIIIPGTTKINVYRPHDWDKLITEDNQGKTFFNEQMLDVQLLHVPDAVSTEGAEV